MAFAARGFFEDVWGTEGGFGEGCRRLLAGADRISVGGLHRMPPRTPYAYSSAAAPVRIAGALYIERLGHAPGSR
jgi:hypothetical protein